MKELENVGEKLGIWKKMELEDSKESVEGKNNILMRTKIKSDELLCQEVERHWAISKDVYDNYCIVQKITNQTLVGKRTPSTQAL